MSMVQEKSVSFESKYMVLPDGTTKELTSDEFEGKWLIVVIFYAAFNNVSTAELIAFEKAIEKLDCDKVEIVGMCRESTFAIVDWMNTVGYDFKNIKMISDLRVDGMVGKFGANGYRGYPNPFTAIIDPHHNIRHICEHAPFIGRSVKETLRLYTALSTVDAEAGAVLSPANYKQGVHQLICNCRPGVDSYYRSGQDYLKEVHQEQQLSKDEAAKVSTAAGSDISKASKSSVLTSKNGNKSAVSARTTSSNANKEKLSSTRVDEEEGSSVQSNITSIISKVSSMLAAGDPQPTNKK